MSHSFTRKVLKWQFCAKCGLIALRNRASDKALLKDCPGKEHHTHAFYLKHADREWSRLKASGWQNE